MYNIRHTRYAYSPALACTCNSVIGRTLCFSSILVPWYAAHAAALPGRSSSEYFYAGFCLSPVFTIKISDNTLSDRLKP